MRLKFFLPVIVLVCQACICFGQDDKIKIPPFNDKYSSYVKKLEAGNTDIDYAGFRNSFLDSRQFAQKGTSYDSLEKLVYAAVNADDVKKVAALSKAMLSIDYTSMTAHKFLRQSYKIQGDSVNQKKYHDIEFGLMNSILNSGDSKTCETGWHVTQIEEEYFILRMRGADLQTQSIDQSEHNMCDKMDVRLEDGTLRTYYFEANKVFEKENELFGGKHK